MKLCLFSVTIFLSEYNLIAAAAAVAAATAEKKWDSSSFQGSTSPILTFWHYLGDRY